MPYSERVKIFRTRVYERKSSRLLREEERYVAEQEILSSPEKWPVISGTGGIRKARSARGSSGKSGGVRILYYLWMGADAVYLLDIYAKNEKENLSHAEKNTLKEIVKLLKGVPHA